MVYVVFGLKENTKLIAKTALWYAIKTEMMNKFSLFLLKFPELQMRCACLLFVAIYIIEIKYKKKGANNKPSQNGPASTSIT